MKKYMIMLVLLITLLGCREDTITLEAGKTYHLYWGDDYYISTYDNKDGAILEQISRIGTNVYKTKMLIKMHDLESVIDRLQIIATNNK